ncbi:MAG TPA: hypothetical protein VFU22_02610 [Roseiflexaceae bacterium]|nr:hypothetical protein [Roseiflexaceae bacterium]
MKDRILAWAARKLAPHLEVALRAIAAEIVAELQAELERRATRPQSGRRFIGQ